MGVRLLLILVLLWHPLMLVGTRAPAEACSEPSCCVSMERVTCCGVRVVEEVCGKTGGECHCAASPNDTPERAPRAPLPRGEREAPVTVLTPPNRIIPLTGDEAGHRSRASTDPGVRGVKTHNQIRAFLGVWRT